MPLRGLHTAARSQENPSYPQRFKVPDDKVPWAVPYADYKPTPFTLLREGTPGIDASDPKSVAGLADRFTYEPQYAVDPRSGAPLNPAGRTGMSERGRLFKWGPNHAADPIVTRYHPTTGELQLVTIKRKDTGTWALPGGMVDAGEKAAAAAGGRE